MEQQEKKNGVYFTELSLWNVRSFGQEVHLDLGDKGNSWRQWTLILGNNGTGKTTILQCIACLDLENIGRESLFLAPVFGSKYITDFRRSIGGTSDIAATYLSEDHGFRARIGFQQTTKSSSTPGYLASNTLKDLFILGYGATRSISNYQLSERGEFADSLFNDNARLINAEEWLLQMDYAASKHSSVEAKAIKKREQIISILGEILPDVYDIRFTTPNEETFFPRVEFNTLYGWIGIRELSLGYKTMITWIVDVAARMFERYSEEANPLEQPVVILVDEIDLHLHPKWQRKIFDFLTERFPRAQFIVTAHSPLVVQSAPKDANIILLRQETDEEGNAYVKIDNDVESVRNWRLDQIMTSDLFGFESTRNPEVERLLNERKQLLQKDDLTTEEAGRLKDLNKMTDGLPTAEDPTDRKAMEVIREAAEVLRKKAEVHD